MASPPPPLPPASPASRRTGTAAGAPPFLKFGYLSKQSAGKWKRRRWNQRWFVLDSETGLLTYFRHASLPEAVHFRQDAHGALHLREKGVTLVIQGDLPRGVPTPFCFTVSGPDAREIRICADSNQEFKEWTNAISLVMSPREAPESNGSVAATAAVVATNRSGGSAHDSSSSSSSSCPPSPSRGEEESASDAEAPRARVRQRSRAQGSSSARVTQPQAGTAARGIFSSNVVSTRSGMLDLEHRCRGWNR